MADNNENRATEQTEDLGRLLAVRREKLAALQEAGKDPFVITKYAVSHHSTDARSEYEELEKKLIGDRPEVNTEGMSEEDARAAKKADYEEKRAVMDASAIRVTIAGRMMSKRVMGKASFCNIKDREGNIQVYVARDGIGEESYADFKKYDIGDIVII